MLIQGFLMPPLAGNTPCVREIRLLLLKGTTYDCHKGYICGVEPRHRRSAAGRGERGIESETETKTETETETETESESESESERERGSKAQRRRINECPGGRDSFRPRPCANPPKDRHTQASHPCRGMHWWHGSRAFRNGCDAAQHGHKSLRGTRSIRRCPSVQMQQPRRLDVQCHDVASLAGAHPTIKAKSQKPRNEASRMQLAVVLELKENAASSRDSRDMGPRRCTACDARRPIPIRGV
jgi:hypothetical protein